MHYSIITLNNNNAILNSESAYHIAAARRQAKEASQQKRHAVITFKNSLISRYHNGEETDLLDDVA